MPLFWIKRASPKSSTTNLRNRGLTLMVIAMIVAPIMDIIAKAVSAEITGAQVVLVRFAFQTAILLPVLLWRLGPAGLKLKRPVLAMLRGVLVAAAVSCFFTSLKWLPVADALAIFFVEPLILTIFSALFLGENVGWRRILAVTVGLVGAMIVIRPSFEVFGLASLLPMATAILFAIYLVLTSKMTKDHDVLALQFTAGASAFVFMGLALLIGTSTGFELLTYHSPNTTQWLLLLVVGLIGTVSHLMLVYAFKWAPASLLAPFHYLEIVVATILGFVFFGNFPDAIRWLGIGIIIASGLYVIWREGRVNND